MNINEKITVEIIFKIVSPLFGTNSSKIILSTAPPSVDESGIAVNNPIAKFIYPKNGFSIEKNIAAKI